MRLTKETWRAELMQRLEAAIANAMDTPSGQEIVDECMNVVEMLLEKNRKYGDSALQPKRIFSRSSVVEQLHNRIDDKLSRIENRADDEDEDVIKDLLGYLILLRIAEHRERTK